MSDRAVRDRDFYRGLIELSTHDAPEPLLRRALEILVELTGAREVYLELRGAEEQDTRRWFAESGCDAARVDAIRMAVSTGIIAQAMASGEIVATSDAVDDGRFQDLASVREHRIEAVLCAPIGRTEPLGVLYLQGRRGASAFEPFSDEVRERVELFVRTLAPLAELLVRRSAEEQPALQQDGGAFARLLWRSELMRETIALLTDVAGLEIDVLLTGPSGTGKSVFARAIHDTSTRRARPFAHVNCASIPESLLESELFGAEAGAYSGASRAKPGHVEAAEAGTLFLDEIGELPLASQAKLLQLLQERVYYRLGSTKLRRADVRIIAATNVSLPIAVAEKKFRADLFYRLKVFEARIPPLSERPEDIAPLAAYFCSAAAEKHRVRPSRLSPMAMRALKSRAWPGNVRELENEIQSAVVRAHSRGGDQVEPRDLPDSQMRGDGPPSTKLHDATLRFQRDLVRDVLESVDWNAAEAARRLAVARSYVYTLIRVHGLRADVGATSQEDAAAR